MGRKVYTLQDHLKESLKDPIFKKSWKKSLPVVKISKQTHLYIDGTNLFIGQNELFGPKRFLSFEYLVAQINKLVRVQSIHFYASYMVPTNYRRHDLKSLISTEAQFYRQVRSTPNLTFFKGHRSPTSGKEKGVDVHLAVDIVKDVFQGVCRQVVIMTGDADLIYPLQIAKLCGIPVHAVFLPNRFSLEIAYRADSATVLNFNHRFDRRSKKLPKNLKIANIKSPVCKHTG